MMDKKFIIGAVSTLSLVALFATVPVFKSVGTENVKAAGEVKVSKSIDEKEVMNLVATAAPEEKKTEIDPTDTFPYDDVVKNSENMYYITSPGSGSENSEVTVGPEDYEDAGIRKMAEKYQKKGMVLTDAKRDAEAYGIGTGVGAFVFTKGFNAVDDTEGNNEFFISVVKATPDEFQSFLDNYKYDLKIKKKDSGITATYRDSMNRIDINYHKDTGILEFVNEFLMEGIG
ncbi:MAG: hypothetical protein VZQ83_02595 [Eubacterium sp.]|nr:hypothetical protein [Eubacterium sp.]